MAIMCKESIKSAYGLIHSRNLQVLIDPMTDYIFLLVFLILQVAIVFYRRPLSGLVNAYLFFLFFLYASHFFWYNASNLAYWAYAAVGALVIFKERRWATIPFFLMNLFNCSVVIPHVGGWGHLSFSMFLGPEYTEAQVILAELDGTSFIAVVWLFLPMVLVYGVVRFLNRKQEA